MEVQRCATYPDHSFTPFRTPRCSAKPFFGRRNGSTFRTRRLQRFWASRVRRSRACARVRTRSNRATRRSNWPPCSCGSIARSMRSSAVTMRSRRNGSKTKTSRCGTNRQISSKKSQGLSMSFTIWTREELLASSLPIEAVAWRAVEAQHRVSTMKLVDTLAEQAALERLLEETKPPIPPDCDWLHYLLYSPFRYARGNPHASRFRRAGAFEGVFYASASPETAICEIVFYRFLFYAESPG